MGHRRNSGMDWIRLPRRLAIYVRDGFDCVYCQGNFPPDPLGYGLSLDHLDGPGNGPENLVTACLECNADRGSLPLDHWLEELECRGVDPRVVSARIVRQVALPLDLDEGHRLALLRRPRYRIDARGRRRRAA